VLVGLLKKILRRRPKDFRVIISSATMDAEMFREFFNSGSRGSKGKSKGGVATVLSVEGTAYPVGIMYSPCPVQDYVVASLRAVLSIHSAGGGAGQPGAILVFLTGKEEIDRLVELINDENASQGLDSRTGHGPLVPLPLYSELPYQYQMAVFEPVEDLLLESQGGGGGGGGVGGVRGLRGRKVIVSTNIAEASVTIPDVVHVVDCGLVKSKWFDWSSGTEALLVTPVSQASARQRAGRAGRCSAGVCYRLYTEESYTNALRAHTVPEIQRVQIEPLVILLKALGVDNIMTFDFLSPPPAELMQRALEMLYALGALDDACRLTQPLGQRIAEFPIDPSLARCLLASAEYSCTGSMLSVAAMLSVQVSHTHSLLLLWHLRLWHLTCTALLCPGLLPPHQGRCLKK
jgi:ATP-dependent RNA helicase DDX35